MESGDFLQYLIPVIFLIVWAIGKIFGGKKEEETQSKNSSEVTDDLDSFEEDSLYDLDDDGAIQLPSRSPPVVMSTSLQHYKGMEKHQHQHEQPATVKVVKSTAVPTVVSYKKIAKQRERSQLLALLKNPHSVKRAVLISEILGSPIALRDKGKTEPRWDQ